MSAVDLTAIVTGITTVLSATTTPAGAKTPAVSVEPPASYNGLPCWLVLEDETNLEPLRTFGRDSGVLTHSISAYLLFAPADQKYSVRERRLWSQPVTDALEGDATNLSGACLGLFLTKIRYGVASIQGLDFLASTFQLRILAARS